MRRLQRSRIVLFPIAVAAIAALALASAGGVLADRGADDPAPHHAGNDDPAGHDSRKKVEIEDFSYRPATLTVAAGSRVVFANRDGVAHTVTRNKGGFDTGRIRPGKAKALRFRRKGTYRFHCTIHPFMKGKIVVK